ncbi:MAG: serine protease [Acidobacteriota bacterium]
MDTHLRLVCCRLMIATCVALLFSPSVRLEAQEVNPYVSLAAKGEMLVDVTFVLKVKMTGGGGDREVEGETTCLLIGADGLVLCSNTELGGYIGLMSQLMGRGTGFDMTATPREIKVVVGDRTEGLDAQLLARDTERDLAWVQIDELPAEPPVAFLDLSKSAELGPGDRFYRLRRLDKFFGSAPIVTEGIVAALLERPRKLLIATEPGSGGFGLPVFTADGRLVGVTVTQMPAAEDQISGAFSGGMSFLSSAAKLQDMMGGLIMPAADLAKATQLARESFAEDDE